MAKSVLGRGLGSLIPQKQTITEQVIPSARSQVLDIPVSEIRENSRQPRQFFSASELEDLIGSIKEHGIIQPLVVTRARAGYELIAGERRLRAARTLGMKSVPVIVREAGEQEKLELALIENIQRQDLNAVEEALAYRALVDEFNLTQEDVAKRIGKSRSNVANILRLLDLESEILIALREGKISKSHGRTLLTESDPKKRMALFETMLKGGVSVREAESRVAVKSKKTSSCAQKDPNILAHEKRLREILGTKVEIKEKAGRGSVNISFYSREELMDLLDRLIT
jgi:ParB family chromosome partitioning protein